ncbi:MAG TPA: hypothetical protein PKI03_14525 [Pseudomonadota bacterium]|nr:hypothetical protein [Pseudomonadota bacterium]
MPQPDSSELESQPPVLDSPTDVNTIDPSSNEDFIDPSTQEIPTEPLPEPPIRITIIPGRETDEELDPGEEVPNIEVEVGTEPR